MINNLYHSKLFTQITSGSGGECLDMKGSDIDSSVAFKDVNVYEDINNALDRAADMCVAMEMEDTKLGFTHLRLLCSQ